MMEDSAMTPVRSLFISLFSAVLLSATTAAQANNAVSSACATLEFMAKMVAINTLLPANYDHVQDFHAMNESLKELNRLACQPVMLIEGARYDSRYNNGRRVSTDLHNSSWHFPNGQLFVARPGRNTAVYYPNGQVMAFSWTRPGQTVHWPNGNPATFGFRTVNEAWYYPDGHIITYLAGVQGARWFYPFARQDGLIGQEMISANWGEYDAHMNVISFTNSGMMFLRRERIRDKLVLAEIELLDVPGVLLMITRIYQAADEARLFIPGDGSITGAPY